MIASQCLPGVLSAYQFAPCQEVRSLVLNLQDWMLEPSAFLQHLVCRQPMPVGRHGCLHLLKETVHQTIPPDKASHISLRTGVPI